MLLSRCGLRAGEVFGLQWGDLLPEGTLLIQRSFARGRLSEPKTRKSKAPIAIPARLHQDLLGMRALAEHDADDSWIFPSSRNRAGKLMPTDYQNWLNRSLKPANRFRWARLYPSSVQRIGF